MQRLARVAIGTVQPGADATFVSWALMAALERAGLRVQHFSARACFSPRDAAPSITGQSTRHLDTWLLEPEACRLLLEHGGRSSDLALIEGRFDTALSEAEQIGGKLATVCRWLDLPSIAVVDACLLRDCQLPERPERLDGILIDGAHCCSEQCRLQTWLEALWGAPVLGFVQNVPQLRAEVTALPMGTQPSQALCDALAMHVLPPSLLVRILSMVERSEATVRPLPTTTAVLPQRRMRIATAYDEAFHCYFPDTLDQLEILGAEIVDFSPLRDDRIPAGSDLVYFGCGRPDLYMHQLVENCCMIASLKRHVEGGGRLYAECGGLAYLGQQIELSDGRRLGMSGVLPLVSTIEGNPKPPTAVEVNLASDCWLGEAGAMLRGYRNGRWRIDPADETARSLTEEEGNDVLGYCNAIGSRVHLNFAMQPTLLERLFEPLAVGQAI
jgi:cobyrinic acid a,c-diamide synthase